MSQLHPRFSLIGGINHEDRFLAVKKGVKRNDYKGEKYNEAEMTDKPPSGVMY